MNRIQSKINRQSDAYKSNYDAYQELIKTYNERIQLVSQGGSERSVNKHHKRGKLLARERINLLVDENTSFLELSTLAAYNLKDNEFPSAGIVTGIGVVHGQQVMIIANDATVKGGTYMEQTIRKHVRAQEIAEQNHLPCIYMVDSGGAFLPDQAKVFPDRFHFGRFFYNQSRMSAKGIPQIAIVMGSCTAGGAYVPAMSDETIIVKNQGTIFIGGPPLVKAATGEEVGAEELGGGEMHTSVSGTADHLAQNDEHAIAICRNIVSTFSPVNKQEQNLQITEQPQYPIDELYGIAPVDLKKPVDCKEIIARIVDGSKFQEFKERYAPTLVTGFAHIMGFPVGIIANNGILFGQSALKGAHFIELCSARNIPLLYLHNISGFMVGKEYEHKGIARDGAKMVHATANANVPKISLVVGGSFGAGNYAMCGRGYDPNFMFMWPNAKISVMGGPQAASVLSTIKKDQLEKRGEEYTADMKEAIEGKTMQKYEEEGSAYYSTARLWDDGIIDPKDTRKVLAMALSACANKQWEDTKFGIFRM